MKDNINISSEDFKIKKFIYFITKKTNYLKLIFEAF